MTVELTIINSSNETNTHIPAVENSTAMRIDATARGVFEDIAKYLSHNESESSEEIFNRKFTQLLMDEGMKRQDIREDEKKRTKKRRKKILNTAYGICFTWTVPGVDDTDIFNNTWPPSTVSATKEEPKPIANAPLAFNYNLDDEE